MRKVIFTVFGLIILTGCIPKKAFQPNPPEFKNWVKSGSTDEDVKAQMTKCGFRNLYIGDSRDTRDDTAKQETCMFSNGYMYNDGYKGICYLYKDWQTLPACVEYRKTHP
jgi:hypothetical protein